MTGRFVSEHGGTVLLLSILWLLFLKMLWDSFFVI